MRHKTLYLNREITNVESYSYLVNKKSREDLLFIKTAAVMAELPQEEDILKLYMNFSNLIFI